MNLVGNNTIYSDCKPSENAPKSYGKTKGLLYNDFCCSDNLLFLIHGRIITCFDLMNKNRSPSHT